jgi:hypothetical protein
MTALDQLDCDFEFWSCHDLITAYGNISFSALSTPEEIQDTFENQKKDLCFQTRNLELKFHRSRETLKYYSSVIFQHRQNEAWRPQIEERLEKVLTRSVLLSILKFERHNCLFFLLTITAKVVPCPVPWYDITFSFQNILTFILGYL